MILNGSARVFLKLKKTTLGEYCKNVDFILSLRILFLNTCNIQRTYNHFGVPIQFALLYIHTYVYDCRVHSARAACNMKYLT